MTRGGSPQITFRMGRLAPDLRRRVGTTLRSTSVGSGDRSALAPSGCTHRPPHARGDARAASRALAGPPGDGGGAGPLLGVDVLNGTLRLTKRGKLLVLAKLVAEALREDGSAPVPSDEALHAALVRATACKPGKMAFHVEASDAHVNGGTCPNCRELTPVQSLDALCAILNEDGREDGRAESYGLVSDLSGFIDAAKLPTFGGEAPEAPDTPVSPFAPAFSYDETRVLVWDRNASRLAGFVPRYKIMSREAYGGE